MTQLTLDVPDELADGLRRLAAEERKSVEQLAIERLAMAIPEPPERREQYARFVRESGLFVQVPEEQRRRYQPVSDERLRELAAKVGSAGPLSQAIIEDRGDS
mgnify:CR=1 FL=1